MVRTARAAFLLAISFGALSSPDARTQGTLPLTDQFQEEWELASWPTLVPYF